MRKMGATSEFYDSHEFSVIEGVKAEKRELYRSMHEEIDGYLTTEQLYNWILA